MTTHAIITEAIDVGLGGDMTRAAALADNGRRRAVAVRELLASEPVRRALTIRLTPETADQLRDELDEASLEPYRCGPRGSASPEPGCPRYVEDMGDRCPQHSDPDEVDR
jgi:hypothetical protein